MRLRLRSPSAVRTKEIHTKGHMADALLDTSRPATGTDAVTNLTHREEQLNQLIISHYASLTEAAYNQYPELLVWDCERVIATLGSQLKRYTGPAEETRFLKWATRFVAKEAQRYEITSSILSEYHRVLHAAIHANLWTSANNLAIEHQDVYWEIVWLIFQKAHALNRKGVAKLSTRLTALVKKHCWLYHNSPNARHQKSVKRWLEEGRFFGCELVSEEELTSMKSQAVYDPDYAECGFSLT